VQIEYRVLLIQGSPLTCVSSSGPQSGQCIAETTELRYSCGLYSGNHFNYAKEVQMSDTLNGLLLKGERALENGDTP